MRPEHQPLGCFLSIDQNPILKQLKLLMCGFYGRTFVSHQLLHIALFLGSWTKKETNSWLWLKFVGQACRTQILHREFVSNWMWNPNHVNLLYFPHCLDFAIAALCTLPADKKTLILITFIAVVFPCGTLFNTIPYRSISTIPLMYHCLIWLAYMHTGPLPKLQVKENPWWYFSTWCFGLILTFLQHSVLLHFRAKTCQHKFSYHIFLKLSLLIDMSNSGLCLLNRSIWRNAKNGQSAVPFTSKPKHCLQYMPFKLWQKPYCTPVSTS